MPFSFTDGCKLNVNYDEAGIGGWLRWKWPVAEIALFESEYRAFFQLCASRVQGLLDSMEINMRMAADQG